MSARHAFLRLAALLLLVGLVGCGSGGGTPSGGGAAPGGLSFPPGITTWLERFNQMRSWAGLPAVTEDPAKSMGDTLHSTYLVTNCEAGHEETPGLPGYTPAGADAGMRSNVVVSYGAAMTDEDALRGWMTAIFHGIGMLDPRLSSTGFGHFTDPKSCFAGFPTTYAAALWTDFGGAPVPPGFTYPVMWPAMGVTVDILTFGGSEFPDPLTSCPGGWTAPTGLPVYLQLGAGAAPPPLMGATTFSTLGGPALEHCIIHWGNYTNAGDAAAESLGRAILGARQCIVLLPREPLLPGTTYSVAVTADGVPHAWTFSTSATAVKPVPRSKAVIR